MFCIECGKQLLDSAKFCGFCGTSVNSNPDVAPSKVGQIEKKQVKSQREDAATRILNFVKAQSSSGFFDNALNKAILNTKPEVLNLFEESLFSFEEILGVAVLNERTKQVKTAIDELSKIPCYAVCTNLQISFISSDGTSLFKPNFEASYVLPFQIIKRVDFIKKTFDPSYISIELLPNKFVNRLIFETNSGFGDNHLNYFYQAIMNLLNNYDANNLYMTEENWSEVKEKWQLDF